MFAVWTFEWVITKCTDNGSTPLIETAEKTMCFFMNKNVLDRETKSQKSPQKNENNFQKVSFVHKKVSFVQDLLTVLFLCIILSDVRIKVIQRAVFRSILSKK